MCEFFRNPEPRENRILIHICYVGNGFDLPHLPRKFKIKRFHMEIDRKNGADHFQTLHVPVPDKPSLGACIVSSQSVAPLLPPHPPRVSAWLALRLRSVFRRAPGRPRGPRPWVLPNLGAASVRCRGCAAIPGLSGCMAAWRLARRGRP